MYLLPSGLPPSGGGRASGAGIRKQLPQRGAVRKKRSHGSQEDGDGQRPGDGRRAFHGIGQNVEKIHALRVSAPVKIGDVLLSDCAGTGADIVATKTVDKMENGEEK